MRSFILYITINVIAQILERITVKECHLLIYFCNLDALRRTCESKKIYAERIDRPINRSPVQFNLSEQNLNLAPNSNQRKHQFITYPTFLPEDFTLDETVGLSEHSTGPLSDEIFKHANTISLKLSQNKSNLHVQLTEDEIKFIR